MFSPPLSPKSPPSSSSSSSRSSPPPPPPPPPFSGSYHRFMYDVFLSFRGDDTRYGFTSHLYHALTTRHIRTFMDDTGLDRGEELHRQLLGAIEGSRISIVVFSIRYGGSRWCLDELVKIMECHRSFGQVVLPVFYHVDPSNVRHRRGAFGEEYYNTRGYHSESDAHVFALTHAANMAGWHVKPDTSEANVIERIVEHVCRKLDKNSMPITNYLVGFESLKHDVMQLLQGLSGEVCVLGIWGMGGSGKSTLAKIIYNQIHPEFVHKSFLADVRETWDTNRGSFVLQEQLLCDISHSKKIKIQGIERGKSLIKEKLCGVRTLVVLDDVNRDEQLQSLCGNRSWIGLGSVVIITTRDKRVLNVLKPDHVIRMKEMDESESLELFSWHAFKKERPWADFNELSRNVVAYCDGLPLALEVLGSYLFERKKQEWRSVLSKLEMIPNDQVQEKLKISFDNLRDYMEKDIFLDICCFFIGKNRAYVTEILDGCGLRAEIGITVLLERSLINVEKNNKLGMHALIRDMGREIVRERSPGEPGKRSRLWFHKDVVDVLSEHTGTKAIEGLALKLQNSAVRFNTRALEKMKRLRLLKLNHAQLDGDYCYIPKNLRWINWQEFPLQYIPEDFYMKNLVAIDLRNSYLTQVWMEEQEPLVLEKLKILNLSHSKYLRSTPDFSKLPNLEKLILKDCPCLMEIHQSVGNLKNLLLINLKDCTNLKTLPQTIYKLQSLKTLIISGCSNINMFEEDIAQMKSMTTLIAEDVVARKVKHNYRSSKFIIPYTNVQYHSEFQLAQAVTRFLDDLSVTEYQHMFKIPRPADLSYHLIGMGNYLEVSNTLSINISQGLIASGSNDIILPGDNYPCWLTYIGEDHSVLFSVPQASDYRLKGMILCIIHSNTDGTFAKRCFLDVLIVNHTKCHIQTYKRDTLLSLNDEEWQGIVSNLAPHDRVQIVLNFGLSRLFLKKTALYLIYDESTEREMEPSSEPNPDQTINRMKFFFISLFSLFLVLYYLFVVSRELLKLI